MVLLLKLNYGPVLLRSVFCGKVQVYSRLWSPGPGLLTCFSALVSRIESTWIFCICMRETPKLYDLFGWFRNDLEPRLVAMAAELWV